VAEVVGSAEGDEVVGFGGAAVLPVDHVVDVEVGGAVAAGDEAGAVAVFDEAAEAAADGAGAASDGEGLAVGLVDGAEVGVAGEEVAQGGGEGWSEVEGEGAGGVVEVGVVSRWRWTR
jgi:hypothetical protein